jgi:hypothetical protein
VKIHVSLIFAASDDPVPYWIVKLDQDLDSAMTEVVVTVMWPAAKYCVKPPFTDNVEVEENRIYYDPLCTETIAVSTLICRVSII